jgi:ABC-type lipoprotein release transport system permease subunit
MNGRSLFRLTAMSLERDRRGAGFSAFGVAVGVGSLLFFVSLGLGVSKVVRERVFPLDATLLDVVPPSISLGSILGGGKLDSAVVDRISALPGVRTVYRKMNVRVPAVTRYDGSFFGAPLRMGIEVLAVGVDPAFIRRDVQLGDFSDREPDRPIPAVVSSRLLEIYNQSFAPARKLPQLAPAMVVGFTFPIEFNRSFVAATAPGPVVSSQIQVVGVSERALLAGVTIPLDTAIRINRTANVDTITFTALTVQAEDPSSIPRIADEIRKMGLNIEDQERRLAQSAGAAVALTTSVLALLSALICVLAAVNIAQGLSASVRARKREIGIMQAVGASRNDIRSLIFAEACAIGLVGGIFGTVGAVAAGALVDRVAKIYLPSFPFRPETFFSFPLPLLIGGVSLGLAAALLGAYWPSRQAAALDPAKILAG